MSRHGSILLVSAGCSSVGLDLARFGSARLSSGLVQPSWPKTCRGEPSFVSTSLYRHLVGPAIFFTLSPGTENKHFRWEVLQKACQDGGPKYACTEANTCLGSARARFGLGSGSFGLGSTRVWLGWLSTQLGPAWPDKARRALAHPVPAQLGSWFLRHILFLME